MLAVSTKHSYVHLHSFIFVSKTCVFESTKQLSAVTCHPIKHTAARLLATDVSDWHSRRSSCQRTSPDIMTNDGVHFVYNAVHVPQITDVRIQGLIIQHTPL